MIDKGDFERIAPAVPILRRADSQLLRDFQQAAFVARFKAGRDIFAEGDPVETIALLISGVVRVYKIGETGREITLYRFGLGQSCILTANAILSRRSFPAIATVEQDVEAVIIPADTFRDWIERHSLWRSFLFDLLSQRLSTVMALVDEVVFRRMDARVASFLANRGRSEGPIHLTHQVIAADLGSSREVISRILEDFAAQGIIRSGRGVVEILDFEALGRRGAV